MGIAINKSTIAVVFVFFHGITPDHSQQIESRNTINGTNKQYQKYLLYGILSIEHQADIDRCLCVSDMLPGSMCGMSGSQGCGILY